VTVARLPPRNDTTPPAPATLLQVSDGLEDVSFLVENEQPLGQEDTPMMVLSLGSAHFLNAATYLQVAAAGMVAVSSYLI